MRRAHKVKRHEDLGREPGHARGGAGGGTPTAPRGAAIRFGGSRRQPLRIACLDDRVAWARRTSRGGGSHPGTSAALRRRRTKGSARDGGAHQPPVLRGAGAEVPVVKRTRTTKAQAALAEMRSGEREPEGGEGGVQGAGRGAEEPPAASPPSRAFAEQDRIQQMNAQKRRMKMRRGAQARGGALGVGETRDVRGAGGAGGGTANHRPPRVARRRPSSRRSESGSSSRCTRRGLKDYLPKGVLAAPEDLDLINTVYYRNLDLRCPPRGPWKGGDQSLGSKAFDGGATPSNRTTCAPVLLLVVPSRATRPRARRLPRHPRPGVMATALRASPRVLPSRVLPSRLTRSRPPRLRRSPSSSPRRRPITAAARVRPGGARDRRRRLLGGWGRPRMECVKRGGSVLVTRARARSSSARAPSSRRRSAWTPTRRRPASRSTSWTRATRLLVRRSSRASPPASTTPSRDDSAADRAVRQAFLDLPTSSASASSSTASSPRVPLRTKHGAPRWPTAAPSSSSPAPSLSLSLSLRATTARPSPSATAPWRPWRESARARAQAQGERLLPRVRGHGEVRPHGPGAEGGDARASGPRAAARARAADAGLSRHRAERVHHRDRPGLRRGAPGQAVRGRGGGPHEKGPEGLRQVRLYEYESI